MSVLVGGNDKRRQAQRRQAQRRQSRSTTRRRMSRRYRGGAEMASAAPGIDAY